MIDMQQPRGIQRGHARNLRFRNPNSQHGAHRVEDRDNRTRDAAARILGAAVFDGNCLAPNLILAVAKTSRSNGVAD